MSTGIIITIIICVTLVTLLLISTIGAAHTSKKARECFDKIFDNEEEK